MRRRTSALAAALSLVSVLLVISGAPVAEAQVTGGPTTPLRDDFERPNENPLSGGGNWAKVDPAAPLDLQLLNGGAERTSGGSGVPRRFWTPTAFGPNQEAWIRVTRLGEWHEDVRIGLRIQNAGTSSWCGYQIIANWLGIHGYVWFMQRRNCNGTFTDIAGGSGNLGSGWIVFRAQGSSLQVWTSTNGTTYTLRSQATDTTFTGGGHVSIGVGVEGNIGPRIEEFGAGTLGEPPAEETPPEQTYGSGEDGRGIHANCGCGLFADPVGSRTGAFTTSVADLDLPGTGVPFAWSRSYTSADATVGRLGPGWTDSYSASLAVQGNGDVIVHGEDGQRVYYTLQGGSFDGVPSQVSWTLSAPNRLGSGGAR